MNLKKKARQKPTHNTQSESMLEEKFLQLLLNYQFPLIPLQQHLFHKSRNWRFDFAWPSKLIAVEIQGFGPGHNSLQGMKNDYEKHNHAVIMGWKLLYFMAHDLEGFNQAQTLSTIRALFT